MNLYKLLEVFFAICSLLGFFFKTQGIISANFFIILGILLLSCYYLIHIIKPNLWGKSKASKSILSRLVYLVFIILILGVMFKWLLWQKSNTILWIALINAFLLLIVVLFKLRTLKDNNLAQYYRKLLIRLLFISSIALMFYQTSFSKLKRTYDKQYKQYKQSKNQE